jgi:diguanylate cyclase (GGDEF)-like protein
MDGNTPRTAVTLDIASLDRFMPMHLRLCPAGRVLGAGPTICRLIPAHRLIGANLFDLVDFRRRLVVDPAGLQAVAGLPLRLNLRDPAVAGLKGLVMPLPGGAGFVLNLSFGLSVAEAVRDLRLTEHDFAPTDLAVEILYLIEAKTAVLEELHGLNLRLNGARRIAEEQALTDTLTGLGNLRALTRVLEELIGGGARFALMHLDLDLFKQVNDTYGHAAGDQVLIEVARTLRRETRKGDTLARVGGDEFVLVFPALDDDAVLGTIAERILARLRDPIPFGEHLCRVSGSIGVVRSSLYPEPEAERMLADADRALYGSKRGGRGCVTMVTREMIAGRNNDAATLSRMRAVARPPVPAASQADGAATDGA